MSFGEWYLLHSYDDDLYEAIVHGSASPAEDKITLSKRIFESPNFRQVYVIGQGYRFFKSEGENHGMINK